MREINGSLFLFYLALLRKIYSRSAQAVRYDIFNLLIQRGSIIFIVLRWKHHTVACIGYRIATLTTQRPPQNTDYEQYLNHGFDKARLRLSRKAERLLAVTVQV
jgi:hypothetical protein